MLLYFTFWMCCYNILQQRELQVAAGSPAPGANATNGSELTTRSTDGADVSRLLNINSSSPDIGGEESTFGTGTNTTPEEAWNITAPPFDTDGLNNVTSAPNTTDLIDDKMWVANITGLPIVKGTPASSGGKENSTFAFEPLGNATLYSNTTPDPGLSNNMTTEWLSTTEAALENNHTTEVDVLTTAAGMNGGEFEEGNGTTISPTIESQNVTSDPGHLTTVTATPGPTELSANSTAISQNTITSSSNATDADVFTSTSSKATSTAQTTNPATTPMGRTTTRVGKGGTTASANTTDDDIKAAIPPKRGDSKALLVIVLALSVPALVIITVAIIIIIVRRRVGNGDKYSVQDAVVESQTRVIRSKDDADLELQIKAQSYYGRTDH